MAWIIRPASGGFDIENHHKEWVGNITAKGNKWDVSFKDAPKLNSSDFKEINLAIGYVIGVGQAVEVYGKEMGLKGGSDG